jgi:hypothetical protein
MPPKEMQYCLPIQSVLNFWAVITKSSILIVEGEKDTVDVIEFALKQSGFRSSLGLTFPCLTLIPQTYGKLFSL